MSEMTFDETLEHFGVKGMKWGVRNDTSGGTSGEKPGWSTKKKVAVGAGAAATVIVGAIVAKKVLGSSGAAKVDLSTPFKFKDAGGNWSTWAPRPGDSIHRPNGSPISNSAWKTSVNKLHADIREATKAQDVISRRNLNNQIGQKITDPELRKKFGLPV